MQNLTIFTEHNLSEKGLEIVALGIWETRHDFSETEYERQRDLIIAERQSVFRRKEVLKTLIPILDSDEQYAGVSFGPLLDDYISIRHDLLKSYQPETVVKLKSIITLARLLFKRQLIHKESGVFYNDKANRRDEMSEIKALNSEIDRITQQFERRIHSHEQ